MARTMYVSLVAIALILSAALPGFAQDSTIAELAVGTDSLSTLVAALTAANLVETFSGEGSFTVFAPTNDAFQTFLTNKGLTAQQLLDSPDLAKYLQYHVLPTKVMAADITNGATAETLAALKIGFDTTDGVKIVHGGIGLGQAKATVTGADIEATNGVVHVIDTVLDFPTMTITELVAGTDYLSTLLAAVTTANLTDALAGEGPFTVFAPTDDGAGATLATLNMTAAELLANPDLAKILQYHVHAGEILSSTLKANTGVSVLGDMTLPFEIDGNSTDLSVLTPSNIVTVDIMATNGIVHTINKVLMPTMEMMDDSAAAGSKMLTWAVASLFLAVGLAGL